MTTSRPRGRTRGVVGETWLRFGLLVIAAFASAVSIGVALWFAVYAERAQRVLQECAAASADPTAWSVCGLDAARHRVTFALAVGVAVMLVAVAARGLQARFGRNGLQSFPLPSTVRRSVVEPVLDSVGGQLPPLRWRPNRPVAMARADGMARPYIEVGANWAACAVRDASAARAVLLHELHHVRSRDVVPSGTAYWLGPVVGLLGLGYLVQLVISTSGAPVLDSALRVCVIVLVIAVGRASVLRSREYEADLAAVRTEPEGLRRLMGGPVTAVPSWWSEPFRVHPSPRARASVVDRPWLTLQPGPGDGIVVGFSAAVGGQVLADLWRTWFSGPAVLLGDVAGWGVAGAVLGAWVTAMLLRSEAVVVTGPRPRLLVFTALTAIAAAAGRLLFDEGVGLPIRWPGQLAFGLVGVVGLWLGLQALVVWIRAAAESAGSGVEVGSRGSGLLIVLGTVLGGLVLGNVGTVATYAGLVDRVGAALDTLTGLVLVVNTFATSEPALVLATVLILSSAVVVVSARRRSAVPRVRRTVVVGVVVGVIAAGAAQWFRSLGLDATMEPPTAALAAQWSVATVIAIGATAAGVRVGLAPQRTCLTAGVASVATAVSAAVLRGDASATGIVLFTIGPATLLAALSVGAVAVVAQGRRSAPLPVEADRSSTPAARPTASTDS